MKHFKLWNALLGWAVFAVAAATYLLTIEPTASFWDCGEFISSAWKLDVGHPPGAPFFMLMGHFASLFAGDVTEVAMYVNGLSALASAFTILFLFWTITALAKKLIGIGVRGKLGAPQKEMTVSQGIGILGAGIVGSLAYTFSDTFWFSAVEGEVYASSSLFTAIVFWAILKWDEVAEEEGSDRWLILIAYLMGLSIGVHLLNLLTIPAIVLVYYFKKYDFSWKGVFVAFMASVGILATVLYGMIPGIPTLAGWFELLFVNTLHCPFNTGLAVYIVLMLAALGWAIYESYAEKSKIRMIVVFLLAYGLTGAAFLKESAIIGIGMLLLVGGLLYYKREAVSGRFLNTASLMMLVIVIGYGSYAALVIRSNADTPMDQNSPDNVFSLKYYLNREQYGDTPLLYGNFYNAPVKLRIQGNMCIPVEHEGHAIYAPKPKTSADEPDEYIVTGHKSNYEYMDEFKTLFPRMHSGDARHIEAYKSWANVKGKKVRYDYCGQQKTDYCPTFVENMRFFVSYQVNYMYWRYFMWNFAGRQNDLQGYGEVSKGNWISGIPFIDNARLGDQDALPTELKENKGHNVYYMLPLLLGILGIVYQLMKKQEGLENFTLTFLLFFLTGLAIVVYLNQTPYQPRERDYAYAGSFYAFCIWIGLGVMALAEWAGRVSKSEAVKSVVAAVMVVVTMLVPAQMAAENWDDHDRSDRYACRDFGANYFKSCEDNAIIYCNGDNDTFPLWYNQEVEGFGTDKRACNLSYLQTDWYIDQLRRPYYESAGVPINWEKKDYISGTNEVIWVDPKLGAPYDVQSAFNFVKSSDPRTKRNGDSYIPTDKLYIPVKPAEVLGEGGIFQGRYTEEELAPRVDVALGRRLTKSDMMVLEMIDQAKWQRPIYFAVTIGDGPFPSLKPYFELTGLAYQITPVASRDGQPRVNTEKMYENMMHQFKYGNMNKPGIYIDENMMRMCKTHRTMFSELARALFNEGQKEKAVEVLDYAEEMLPGCNVPYDYVSVSMADIYALCGEKEKGEALYRAVAQNCVEYLRWGVTLDRNQRASVQSTLEQQGSILSYLLQHAERQGLKDFVDEYYPYFAQYCGAK